MEVDLIQRLAPEGGIVQILNRKSVLIPALALLVFACGEQESSTRQVPAAEAGVDAAASTTQASATATPAGAAPAVEPPPAGVIASTDGETEGTRIDVTKFERASGDTVNLRFNVVNGSSEGLSMNSLLTDTTMNEYYTAGGIHLVDPVNKRKYFVVRDAENKCVCSREIKGDIEPGGKVSLWAKLPAPPPDVQSISIIFPKFIPLDDVPLK